MKWLKENIEKIKKWADEKEQKTIKEYKTNPIKLIEKYIVTGIISTCLIIIIGALKYTYSDSSLLDIVLGAVIFSTILLVSLWLSFRQFHKKAYQKESKSLLKRIYNWAEQNKEKDLYYFMNDRPKFYKRLAMELVLLYGGFSIIPFFIRLTTILLIVFYLFITLILSIATIGVIHELKVKTRIINQIKNNNGMV